MLIFVSECAVSQITEQNVDKSEIQALNVKDGN